MELPDYSGGDVKSMMWYVLPNIQFYSARLQLIWFLSFFFFCTCDKKVFFLNQRTEGSVRFLTDEWPMSILFCILR